MMIRDSRSCSRRSALQSVGRTVAFTALVGWLSPAAARADSLWVTGESASMVGDKRAMRVGDLLHILVQENNSTSKNNNTTTKKATDVDAKIATFLYSPAASGLLTKSGQMPALKFNSSYDFNGGGKIENSERIAARVAVMVVDVLPNANLVVEGRRQTAFAGETQEIILRGVVRPADITPANAVFSYNVADASIRFVSKGVVTDSQRKGWFMRLWEKVTPF
jgi:flagellar L-ring protein FlgH